jgi:hypothetical protein
MILIVSLFANNLATKAQNNPTAFDLSTGSWTLTGWNTTVPALSYTSNGATGVNNTTGVIAGATNANMRILALLRLPTT